MHEEMIVVGCLVIFMGSLSSGLPLTDCEQAIYNCCDEETHSPLSLRSVSYLHFTALNRKSKINQERHGANDY